MGPVSVFGSFFGILDRSKDDFGDVTDQNSRDDQREENVGQNGERLFLQLKFKKIDLKLYENYKNVKKKYNLSKKKKQLNLLKKYKNFDKMKEIAKNW